ncbi:MULTISPECIES: ABC transporter permease [unclassified Hyphomicrobium]|uniref:ABC transporter permease n=1 Tax=unclassified Hyphomicrobium TaxID=2619925 RepID=UPI000213F944|nr:MULTISPECIES: ABC transporter permease subunit [unclassified Hyphomicrobium]CCB63670.1 Binding-protein-dependent transport systems inner membrane component [Hyphomicrobium sp. MC1]
MPRIINIKPNPRIARFLGLVPFIALIILYLICSEIRLHANPNDKLLPPFSAMGSAISHLAFSEDTRTGQYLFWADTFSSLRRLAIGLGTSFVIAIVVGTLLGLIPYAAALANPFVAVLALVPPLALLPILFIAFGLDELSKIVLIILGVTPYLIRDLALRIEQMPYELLVKAQTMGASTWQIMTRIVLPQMLPRVLDGLRFSIGPAWLFLIAAEAIASTDGLGYRIFLVRRYLAMDIIIPYVIWITALAFLMDYGLRILSARLFPWAKAAAP